MTPFTRNMIRAFYALLLVGGLMFYLLWGVVYGVWVDIGLYSITIVMVMLGALGTIIYSKDREEFHVEEEEL